ncbi:MAG TPA: YeeE/YedE thiosulfate transporter family protein [Parvularculaceae bacterium]|nr:YeeE/YedE thiosulfate transporter family protein [Parvularculaceae bacterium]
MDIAGFTPVSAAIGGGLIGAAAVLLMALNGRIAGVSGIVAGVMAPLRGEGGADFSWRLAFVAGLVLAPLLASLVKGEIIAIATPHPLWMMALGGLLVGYGTRLGSGCTSGHGVCGVARLSTRSFAATATFMAAAIVSAWSNSNS